MWSVDIELIAGWLASLADDLFDDHLRRLRGE